MKVILQGFDDVAKALDALAASGYNADEIVCSALDDIAGAAAEELGVPITPIRLQEEMGDYGYPMQNMEMAKEGEALVCNGTDSHLIACCRKKQLPIHVAL